MVGKRGPLLNLVMARTIALATGAARYLTCRLGRFFKCFPATGYWSYLISIATACCNTQRDVAPYWHLCSKYIHRVTYGKIPPCSRSAMRRNTTALSFVQLMVVSASLLCCLGHLQTVYYQFAVRFLYEETCNYCSGVCSQRVSQCAKLEFHYFNVTILNHNQNCTARVMLLLLELKQAKRKDGDSVYLDACIDGMKDYHFWNYLACSTVTEGGGREADYVQCRPNEILSLDVTSTTALPIWVPIVCTVLAVILVIALLTMCVMAYQLHHYRTGRADIQRRDPPLLGASVQYEEIAGISPVQPQRSRWSQWLREKGLVPPNWFTPTARNVERQQPQGSSSDTSQPEA